MEQEDTESRGFWESLNDGTRKSFLIFLVILGGIICMSASGFGMYFGIIVPQKEAIAALPKPVCDCPTPPICPTPTIKPCDTESPEPCKYPLHPQSADLFKDLVPACPKKRPCKAEYCTTKPLGCPSATTPAPKIQINGTGKMATAENEPLFNVEVSNEYLMNTTFLDSVMKYPVNSMDRLRVITKYMELYVEPAIAAYSKRSCDRKTDEKLVRKQDRLCTFCQDRYEYIRCVLSKNVKRYRWDDTKEYKVPAFPQAPSYWEVFSTFATAAERFSTGYKDEFNWYEDNGKSLYTTIRKVKKAFWLATEHGEECQICTDLDETVHSECIREGAKWD